MKNDHKQARYEVDSAKNSGSKNLHNSSYKYPLVPNFKESFDFCKKIIWDHLIFANWKQTR